MNQGDFDALCQILQDKETMYAYEGPFSDQEVQEWLDRQIARYQKWNFGLWAVILKETGKMIGQCGLTMQPWKETEVLEIGYLFNRAYGTKDMQRKRQKPVKITLLKHYRQRKCVRLSETPTSPLKMLP